VPFDVSPPPGPADPPPGPAVVPGVCVQAETATAAAAASTPMFLSFIQNSS
jgi:hypothetical protein